MICHFNKCLNIVLIVIICLHVLSIFRDECYSSTYPASIKTRHACMKAYLQFEAALDKLEKPVAIVCKSSRRAGAVYSAFKGMTLFKGNK